MYREITGYKSISIAIFSTFLYVFGDFGFCSVFSADVVRMTRSFQRTCFQLPCNSCRRNVIIEQFLHSWHFHKKQLFKKLENKRHVWPILVISTPEPSANVLQITENLQGSWYLLSCKMNAIIMIITQLLPLLAQIQMVYWVY